MEKADTDQIILQICTMVRSSQSKSKSSYRCHLIDDNQCHQCHHSHGYQESYFFQYCQQIITGSGYGSENGSMYEGETP